MTNFPNENDLEYLEICGASLCPHLQQSLSEKCMCTVQFFKASFIHSLRLYRDFHYSLIPNVLNRKCLGNPLLYYFHLARVIRRNLRPLAPHEDYLYSSYFEET